MGKIKQAHRKKVQARNARIAAARRAALKTLASKSIVHDYTTLTERLSEPQVLETLSANGPQFRGA